MGERAQTEKKSRCILICAGDLEIAEIQERQEGDLVIAVDGGYLYCQVLGIEPDVVLGDFDSLEEDSREQIGAGRRMISLNPVKDDTDTLAALRFGLAEGYREFHLYGALGGRLEHTLANLQCLLFLKREGASGYIWDSCSMTTVIENESLTFRGEMEGMLSVFAMGGTAEGVGEKGLRYQLDQAVLTETFPVGISNEFIGEQAEVSVKKGALLIIVRWA